MADYNRDIERYLNGEMAPAERHALEKKALSDPFLSDALEGAHQLSTGEFVQDIADINYRIANRKNNNNRLWWMVSATASVLLLAIATYVLFDSTSTITPTPIALKNEKQQPTTQATPETKDSIAEAKDRKRNEQPSVSTYSVSPALAAKPEEERKGDERLNAGPVTEEKVDALADVEPAAELAVVEELPAAAAPVSSSVVTSDKAKKESVAEPERKVVTRSSQVAKNVQQIIQGQITSAEDGSPLPGINVVVKGSTVGTVTDEQGRYVLNDVESQSTLVYSFIGLQTQEIPVADRTQVDVTMALDVTQLSEVVVTGYSSASDSPGTPVVDIAHPEIGFRAYRKYLEENVRYPQSAREAKVEGRVTVDFFVETDGRLTNFEVVRGIGNGCDEELIRLIQEGPRWIPTKKDNLPVREKARVRLKFELPK